MALLVRSPVHRLQEPCTTSPVHGRAPLPRRDNDHQNNANFIRSRCDRVSIRTTRRFPFDLWPLSGDKNTGVGKLETDGSRCSASLDYCHAVVIDTSSPTTAFVVSASLSLRIVHISSSLCEVCAGREGDSDERTY